MEERVKSLPQHKKCRFVQLDSKGRQKCRYGSMMASLKYKILWEKDMIVFLIFFNGHLPRGR